MHVNSIVTSFYFVNSAGRFYLICEFVFNKNHLELPRRHNKVIFRNFFFYDIFITMYKFYFLKHFFFIYDLNTKINLNF